ncbi:cellulose biosynthesis protein BcsE [Paraburkholderia sp. MMS20-SJTR3]|uniref:Cellulose biosynthesis protein BcsE n=1 Tax=Paraburkholderia sejongensis TaxID=2886946 RepID=A0ABS8JMA5_9BURK|nr:cellulose biosynthesis protein BcsE [Paraburkholderia sp. MMS20-SJTR3]MCC8391028.1 cellulose biosynthesis protein BcsE [Paraburkholderia sp. MMS20-SJTR3]
MRAFGRAGAQRAAARAGRLAIEALPAEWAALETGKLYAIYAAPRTPGTDALLWDSARAARTRDVTVVLARERAAVAARLRELGFGSGAPAAGWPRNLNVLAMPPLTDAHAPGEGDAHRLADEPGPGGGQPHTAGDPASALPAGRVAPLARLFGGLRALKRFGLRARALYFIEGAERWFDWDDAAALAHEGRMLANWCAARRITMVLLLGVDSEAAGDEAGSSPCGALHSAAGHASRNAFHAACAGVARMESTHGELLWHADFWRADRTLVTGEVRALRFTEGGRLSVAADTPAALAARGDGLLARDEQRVVVSRAVVRGHEAWLPPQWEVYADHAAVLTACADAQAATVVLDYAGGAQLEALCATIHALRRRAGRALKIVVAERGEVLRHQYELLVLTLGVNLVLGRDLPFSRLQSLLQSLQGQLYTRALVADYRSALSAALSDDVRGYLPAGAFCEQVRSVLERSAALQLPHVLVKLTLLPQTAHVDALRHCVPRRAGDVLTADASHLYVFLFACRLADADAALARIVEVPVAQLAATLVHLPEQRIGAELDALEALNRRTRIADYSDLFAAPAAGPAAAVQASSPHAARLAADQLAQVEAALVDARAQLHHDDSGGHAASRTPGAWHSEPTRIAVAGDRSGATDGTSAPDGAHAADGTSAADAAARAAATAQSPAAPTPTPTPTPARRRAQRCAMPVRARSGT